MRDKFFLSLRGHLSFRACPRGDKGDIFPLGEMSLVPRGSPGSENVPFWDQWVNFAAPLLTRGSTPDNPAAQPRRLGSPAHAGIDPPFGNAFFGSLRLPCSRGDRPEKRKADRERLQSPLLTRGSTRTLHQNGLADAGSPAHAGIDPTGDDDFI